MKDLFHGTTADFTEISLQKGKGYKDFGKGFYATAVKSHAERRKSGRKIPDLRRKYIRRIATI